MSIKEKVDVLQTHVMGLFNQGNREGARACISLWEELVGPELGPDDSALIGPRLSAMHTLLGSY